ncbi:hypothetical protein FQR65_LT02188 [Abscondita terminalis]|nr:hypothetical protein FQR65_LT02188 [Abscondita terminalis]
MKLLIVIAIISLALVRNTAVEGLRFPCYKYCKPNELLELKREFYDFDFNCVPTTYLLNVTKCLCEERYTCVTELFNRCIRQPVPDDIACNTNCTGVNEKIERLKNQDFQCFLEPDFAFFKLCLCWKPDYKCPGNTYNKCFKGIFEIIKP